MTNSRISSRRARLGAVAVLLLLGAAVGLWLLWGSPPTEDAWLDLAGERSVERLNVVLVTIDTLRADHLGAYGYDAVETPNIDRLAAEGVRFANAATTVPFTLPAHSSMMTGVYPPFHGVRENVGYFLDDDLPTLAEILADEGYATGGFVSAFVLDARWGIGRGFDRYFDDFDVGEMERANLGSVQRPGNETVEEAIRWLDGREDGPDDDQGEAGSEPPFFLWLHLFEPHDPYTPPGPYLERYPDRPYDGEIAYADYLVGQFRTALERRGLLEDTLVVLTGDHGEGLGDHRETFHGYFVYDSTVHVPLILRAPFGDLGGRVVEEAVSHVDLLPTVLSATGRDPVAALRRWRERHPDGASAVERPATHLQGRSLLPFLLDPDRSDDRVVYVESYYPLYHYGWAPLRSLRSADEKYIDAPLPELYDLAEDPGERRNLFKVNPRHPARQDWKERLTSTVGELEFTGERDADTGELDEETLDQLRALGYVAGRGAVEEGDPSGDRPDPKDKIELHQLVMQAQNDVGNGDDAAAEEKLRRVLEQDDGILDAHQVLGNIEHRRGDHRAAVEHFRNALELDPDHKNSLFGLAEAYRAMGRVEDALVGYRRLLELNPHEVKAALAISRIHVDRGEEQKALEALRQASAGEGTPAILHNQVGELLTMLGRSQEALERFRRAARVNDDLAQPHFNLSVIYEERGQVREAMRHYEAAIERAPDHYRAQFNLGRLHGRLGEWERQRELFEAAIDSNPEFARGYFFLAKLLMDRGGDLARAESLTRTGLEKDPTHETGPLGYFLLADILNRRGRPAEARQALSRARRIQATNGAR